MDREPDTDALDRSVAAGACWELRLLGGVQARKGQRLVRRWPSRAVAALLARLALAPQREHPREELIELLWPGVALDVGRNRLRQALSTLRSLLEDDDGPPVLRADRRALQLVAGRLVSDVQRFEQAVRGGPDHLALARYGGELMPGFFDDWIVAERHRLQALADRLHAPPPVPRPSSALPAYLTRCFGLEPQAARLRKLVSHERLVALVGPGGVGKTRLAVELAQALRDTPDLAAGDPAHPRFDAVVFVPLADCRDAGAALDTLAQAVGAGGAGGDGVGRLLGQLRGRRALLVLDNLEHLLPGLAAPLAQLMARTGALHLLLTSRRASGLDGEHEFRLGPLPVPTPTTDIADLARNPAVALFVDRARAVRPDFRLDARNVDATCDLVSLLGGLPLALELAAARVRSFGLAELRTRLLAPERGGMAGTLPLLSRAAPRGGPDTRHASMEQVIGWSWALLTPPVQQLLSALAVFAGGFDARAAAAVVDGVPDVALALDEAVQHSLLTVDPGPAGAARLRMSEPVREFALARLPQAEAARLRQRHRDAMLAWARALPDTPPLAEVRAERANVAAALASANADGVPEQALALALALRAPLDLVPPAGGALDQLHQAVQRCGGHADEGPALALLALLEYEAGAAERSQAHIARALALAAPGSAQRLEALRIAVHLSWTSTRDPQSVQALLDEAEPLARALDDKGALGALLGQRAYAQHLTCGEVAQARLLFEQAARLREAHPNRHKRHNAWYHLANVASFQGLLDESVRGFQRVRECARAEDDVHLVGMAADALGGVLARQRRWHEALDCFRESAELALASMDQVNWAYTAWNTATVLVRIGQAADAARLMGFAARHWTQRYGELSHRDRREAERVRRQAAVSLGRDGAAQRWQEGEALTEADAVRLMRRHFARAAQA